MSGALDGLLVLDRSGGVAGEYCARLLHDFGAEVWLDEVDGSSATRAIGPFAADGRSLTHLHLNRGKRLGRPAGAPDVLLCAGREDVASVAARHPLAVVVQITAFGSDGPMAGWAGPEIVLQAASGMMNANGIRGREPLYGVGQRAAYAAGLAAYVQTLASLRLRARTGRGDVVRIDAAETAAAMAFPYVLQAIYNGTDRRRGDQEIPAGQVLCRGAYVCLWVYSNRFERLCRSLRLDACLTDPRFAAVTVRSRNWRNFFDLVQGQVADRDPDDWVAELQAMGVISARAFRPSELRASRHLAARGYWQHITIDGQRYVLPGALFRLSRTPARPAAEADHAAT
jgi:crotonobetainyl-CoA:carnitine CoA-transferase CaiB-like acyl-CoA transferase